VVVVSGEVAGDADDTQPRNPNKTPKMPSFSITQVRGRLRGG
jgi:hypothetical protein